MVVHHAATRLRPPQVDVAVAICARPPCRSHVTAGRQGPLLGWPGRCPDRPSTPSLRDNDVTVVTDPLDLPRPGVRHDEELIALGRMPYRCGNPTAVLAERGEADVLATDDVGRDGHLPRRSTQAIVISRTPSSSTGQRHASDRPACAN